MSSTRKQTANTTTFTFDQKYARTKRATHEAKKRSTDLENIQKLKTNVLILTSKQVKCQNLIRQSIARQKMKVSKTANEETNDEHKQQLIAYVGLIKKTKEKIATLEKSLSSKGGRRRKRKTMKR